ncbi:MAG: CHAT domain-containing protein [Gemmatimonadetes bacterium]|nr:CHAT domain-containing protein [Gemmatimonadota bacterium]
MRTAAALSRRPAPILADLAAAYLLRAEREHSPRDLLAAAEVAGQALEHDPRDPTARYNLALALQRFGLVEEAAEAWETYLAGDSASAWAMKARGNLQAIRAIHAPPALPRPGALVDAFSAYAAADPQGARVAGWCRVLGEWGEAVLAGDGTRADSALARADALGSGLERLARGDTTVAGAVRAIRRAGDPAVRQALARGHRAFSAGCGADDHADFTEAGAEYATAERNAAASPSLETWARVRSAGVRVHGRHPRLAEPFLRAMEGRTDTLRSPALAGTVRVLLTALLVRTERYEAAAAEAERAAALFHAAGEGREEAIALHGESVALFALRDVDRGYALAFRAMRALRPYRGSYKLHNLLGETAAYTAADGFIRTALRIQDEDVRVSRRTGSPVYVVEAQLGRARLLVAAGHPDAAGRVVDAIRDQAAALHDTTVYGWMQAQRQIAQSLSSLRTRPAEAAARLDSATGYYMASRNGLLAFPPLVASAEARLQAGDADRGSARLEEAFAFLEARRDSVRMEPRRAAIFDAARALVDRVVMLRLAAGDTVGALSYLDRGRASLAPAGGPGSGKGGVPAAPPGTVAVEYARVRDTLLIWTVAGTRVRLARVAVDTLRLQRTVETLRERLEAGAPEGEVRPALAWLYELLVRPVAARLAATDAPLMLVVDGELAEVPYPALYDTVRGRYLVQDHPLRFVPSLREAARAAGVRRPPRPPLFVGDPAFDRAAHPEPPRLRQSAAEARRIAGWYPGARVIEDVDATPAAVRAAFGSAGMVHYAGHAVFDDERPERSYLLLAAEAGGDGTLRAGQIAGLDLRGVKLVVLSACETVRTGRGRAAGYSGLAGAFLAAGAGGTVASLWEVDDRVTRPLMAAFHRNWLRSGNASAALRAAQLEMLGAHDARTRTPAAWAAFRYTGQ